MFNSNEFLWSKIIDSDENEVNSSGIMKDINNSTQYKVFRRTMSTLNFNNDDKFDVKFDDSDSDNRSQSMKALMNTETTYLRRIKELLTNIFNVFEKDFDRLGRRTTMYQVASIFDKFPAIYELHLGLHIKLKSELQSSKNIGNILYEFLSQPKLLEVYSQYIDSFSNSLDICKSLKDRKYLHKRSELMSLEAIIMSPIQRFPQLTMAIGDIYKHTPKGHVDVEPLFKSVSISKSITGRLDRQRREFEYTNFSDMANNLLRLKLPFCSKQLLANNSVYDVRTDFHIPRRITKVPYYLILCDRNVVMLPRDVPLADLTDKITFCYSLDEIKFNQKFITNFRDLNYGYSDFDEVRDLYRLVNDTFSNDVIIKEYEALLNDYKILLKLTEDLHNLNFCYKGIDALKMTKSMIQLEQQLKAKEIELNLQLGSILTLNIKTNNVSEYTKVYLFDSIRQSNEWKMTFNRAKLLLTVDMTSCWKYYSFAKKVTQIRAKELPVQFDPFKLKDNGIVEITSYVIRSLCVSLVVGLKIYRCLWMCLANGWIIILHFDYNQWRVLESFKMALTRDVNAACVSASCSIQSPDYPYDSEIWMASGDTILIYSLLDNQRENVRRCLNLPSEVQALCNVDGKMFVAMKSKKVFIYSKSKASFWLQDSELSFMRYLASFTEELLNIYYGNGFVYVLFRTKVIICNNVGCKCVPFKVFESPLEITNLCISADGVWVITNSSNQLMLYDRLLDLQFQMISIPLMVNQTSLVGNITAIYMNEKYTWLGTENGFIIAIATIDSLYCTDRNIPMYFSSVSSIGPITQLIPFQNIHGISLKCPPEDFTSKKSLFDPRVPLFRRSMSNGPMDEVHQTRSYSCQSINRTADSSNSDLDSSSTSSLQSAIENVRNTTPTLILAVGSGIANHMDTPSSEKSVPTRDVDHINQSTLFTFLE